VGAQENAAVECCEVDGVSTYTSSIVNEMEADVALLLAVLTQILQGANGICSQKRVPLIVKLQEHGTTIKSSRVVFKMELGVAIHYHE
jgi:hypothetical protein